MNKDEALQLALNSMKEIIHWYAGRDRNDVFLNFVDQNPEIQKIMKSISVVKETLETKDDPVAMRYDFDGYGYKYIDNGSGSDWQTRIKDAELLYTTPQQRTWVELTQEEFEKLINDAGFTRSDLLMMGACVEEIVYLVEAKLKEKNNAT
jgi:hypothetical protein